MDDLGRLGDRVRKLQQHFGQTSEDVRQVLISVEKIEKRGGRIRDVEFGDEGGEAEGAVAGTAELQPVPLRKLEANR
jgi:DNA recombination protein RmuC